MITIASIALFLALSGVALLHLGWALGSTYPCADERTLARTVAGFARMEAMPPKAASLAVAVIVAVCALWPFVMLGSIALPLPGWVVTWGGIKLALIFGLRGLAGYTGLWRRLTPEEPFATLDRRAYSPFCLAVSAGFIFLTLERFA